MSSSTTRFPVVLTKDVTVTEDALAVELFDGRSIFVPLAWYPPPRAWKARGTLELAIGGSRRRHSLASTRRGYQRREPSAGQASGENQRSLKKWLSQRA